MLLGYNKRFADPILIGTKVHTMRFTPKRMPKIGETLYMYSGLRTSQCSLITDKEKLISWQDIWIEIDLNAQSSILQLICHVSDPVGDGAKMWKSMDWQTTERFVQFDGFTDPEDFMKYWTNNGKHRKVGGFLKLFHWTDLLY